MSDLVNDCMYCRTGDFDELITTKSPENQVAPLTLDAALSIRVGMIRLSYFSQLAASTLLQRFALPLEWGAMRSFGRGRRRAGLMVYFQSDSHFSEVVPSMGHEACERKVDADYAVMVCISPRFAWAVLPVGWRIGHTDSAGTKTSGAGGL